MDKQISIDHLVIKGLFNRINYNIHFNNSDNISIIIAPNGCGKTTIFKMIDFITNPTMEKFGAIFGVPFKTFECFLSNGCILRLDYKKASKKDEEKSTAFFEKHPVTAADETVEKLKEVLNYSFSMITGTKSPIVKSFAKNIGNYHASFVRGIDYDESSDSFSKKRFETFLDQVDYYFGLELRDLFKSINKEMKENNCKIDSLFIVANRIKEDNHPNSFRNIRSRAWIREANDLLPLTPNSASLSVAKEIKTLKEDYNNRLSSAKDDLAKRYLESTSSDYPDESFETFSKRWNAYYDELAKFADIGFLSKVETIIDPDKLEESYNDKEKKVYLHTHLEVFEKTLNPLKKIYDKYKLLADILNERNKLTGKTITFDENGIHVISNGKEISLDCLSSGEKNDLIMFYSLIFITRYTSLVLIDEPEISLHIEWQEQYIDYLLKICKINNFKAIIATHSPNIINGHSDLLAERNMENYGYQS